MSVANLTSTTINVYGCINTQDKYGADYPDYYLKYKAITCRTRYLNGQETFINSHEMNVPIYRIYIPYQLDILESDLVIDINRNRKYDVYYCNKMDRKHHMQLDAKRVDEILGEFCPNTIKSINASIVVGAQAFTLDHYNTVEINSTTTKNHFIPMYNGSTVGKTSSDRVYYGDNGVGNMTHTSWQSIIINNITYYIPIYSGSATTGCATDLIGDNII